MLVFPFATGTVQHISCLACVVSGALNCPLSPVINVLKLVTDCHCGCTKLLHTTLTARLLITIDHGVLASEAP